MNSAVLLMESAERLRTSSVRSVCDDAKDLLTGAIAAEAVALGPEIVRLERLVARSAEQDAALDALLQKLEALKQRDRAAVGRQSGGNHAPGAGRRRRADRRGALPPV